jgi:hypothetical protein
MTRNDSPAGAQQCSEPFARGHVIFVGNDKARQNTDRGPCQKDTSYQATPHVEPRRKVPGQR